MIKHDKQFDKVIKNLPFIKKLIKEDSSRYEIFRDMWLEGQRVGREMYGKTLVKNLDK